MTLPEAMKIVSDNANKLAKHNYWDVYLPAILVVNEAFPVTGYVTVDDANGSEDEAAWWRQDARQAESDRRDYEQGRR